MKAKNECGKCGGRGYIKCYEHVAGGVCFNCNGSGYAGGWTALKVKPTKELAKLPGCNARQTAEILNDGGATWTLKPTYTIEAFEKDFGHYLRSGLWDLQDYKMVCLDEVRLNQLRVEALTVQYPKPAPDCFFF